MRGTVAKNLRRIAKTRANSLETTYQDIDRSKAIRKNGLVVEGVKRTQRVVTPGCTRRVYQELK